MSASPASSSSTATTTEKPRKMAPQTRNTHSQKQTSWNPLVLIERKLFNLYWHVESVFALSMLEAWEVFLVIVIFLTLTSLILYSLIFYFPRHIKLVAQRGIYYVYGTVPSSAAVQASSIISTQNTEILGNVTASTWATAAAKKLDL